MCASNSYDMDNVFAYLTSIGISNTNVVYNASPSSLISDTIRKNQGKLINNGALLVKTGLFTGRSPKDKYIVRDEATRDTVDWGDVNIPFESEDYDNIYSRVTEYLNTISDTIYVKDLAVCSKKEYVHKVCVITEYPWSSLFADNMFIRDEAFCTGLSLQDWKIVCVPGFLANPTLDKTRSQNFSIINFSRKTVLIGGSAYTGEIKKSMFSVLNYVLPLEHAVLPMHCSVNVGKEKGDTAVFFGLSGTGKTTLSSDENRILIGDDEHGWKDDNVFNFEGGCYAKTIHLKKDKEPIIYDAIRFGALVENVTLNKQNEPIYSSDFITQNTRVSYPLHHVKNTDSSISAKAPENIFFLTCDAFGVLPPVSKLNREQAIFHFILGYTSKIAGTESGIIEPKTTFSSCFAAPFLPLHPLKYAKLLEKNIERHKPNVWLINTGWTGGSYGKGGERIALEYTRAMISEILSENMENIAYEKEHVFGLSYPTQCEGVPSELLNPRNLWKDKIEYDRVANTLMQKFLSTYEKYNGIKSKCI